MTQATLTFLSYNPTLLGKYGGYCLYEHPIHGDAAPIFMTTPDSRLINTGFWDMGDFDLDLCIEIDEVG